MATIRIISRAADRKYRKRFVTEMFRAIASPGADIVMAECGQLRRASFSDAIVENGNYLDVVEVIDYDDDFDIADVDDHTHFIDVIIVDMTTADGAEWARRFEEPAGDCRTYLCERVGVYHDEDLTFLHPQWRDCYLGRTKMLATAGSARNVAGGVIKKFIAAGVELVYHVNLFQHCSAMNRAL